MSFLRVRGGVSYLVTEINKTGEFSPRTRRCFQAAAPNPLKVVVFSAYAEVFPRNYTHR